VPEQLQQPSSTSEKMNFVESLTVKTGRKPKIFMMDLLAIVPYYTAYLSRALLSEGIDLQLGSISYYLDPDCFRGRGLKPDPGLLDVVGRFNLPKGPRRILKLAEAMLNMAALSLRFLFSPPDVVHVQYLPMLRWKSPFDLWFVSFCQRRGSKIVLTVHDLLPHDTADTHKSLFQNLYRRTDALICHSESIKARLISEFGIKADKISVIPHGPFFYDLPTIASPHPTPDLNMDPHQQLVLWQGIIFPYKGIDLLLNAWQTVEAQAPTAWLVVLGTGAPDLLSELRQQAHHLGLARVRFDFRFASVEELVTTYRAADIVVYPYRAITTSGALATGLAFGKPIVASNLPVFRELLTNGEDAFLIEPSDPGELASAITRLLGSAALRQKFASAIRAKNFGSQSWVSIAQQTVHVYEAVLADSCAV
jgi:glycosyltransferase involved in cell wall biosynthesis